MHSGLRRRPEALRSYIFDVLGVCFPPPDGLDSHTGWGGGGAIPGGAGFEIRICVKRRDSSWILGVPEVPGEGDERGICIDQWESSGGRGRDRWKHDLLTTFTRWEGDV